MSLGLDKYMGPQFQAPAKQAICENLHVRRTNTGTRIYSKQLFVIVEPSRGHRETKPLQPNAPKHMHKKLHNLWWWWSQFAAHNKYAQTFQWCDSEMWFMTLQTAFVKTLFIFSYLQASLSASICLFWHPSQQFLFCHSSSGIPQQLVYHHRHLSAGTPHLFCGTPPLTR